MKSLKNYYYLLVLAGIFLFHAINNYIYLRIDNQPPFDDYAWHLLAALNIATYPGNLVSMVFVGMNSMIRDFYPPLFHVSMAISHRLFGMEKIFAIMANIPYLGLLITSLFLIGKKMGNRNIGLLAAFLVLMYPIVFEMSKLSLVGFALTSMVAFSVCCLLYTDDFSNRTASTLFGLSAGLGMLTKQVFIFFIIGPLAFTFICMFYKKVLFQRKRILNIILFISIALLLSSYLYMPRLSPLFYSYVRTGYGEAGCYYDRFPGLFSFDSFSYYFNALVHIQMLPFLFMVFVIGLFIWLRKKNDLRIKTFLLFSIVVTYAIFTLIRLKEPNSTFSYLIFFALVSSAGLVSIETRWLKFFSIVLVCVLSLLQYFDISYKNDIFFSYLRKVSIVKRLAPRYPLQPPVGMAVSYAPRSGDWKIDSVVSFLKSKQEENREMIIGVSDYDPRRRYAGYDNYVMTNKATYEYYFKVRNLPYTVSSLEYEFGPRRPIRVPDNEEHDALPDALILEKNNGWDYSQPLDIKRNYVYQKELALPDGSSIYLYEKRCRVGEKQHK